MQLERDALDAFTFVVEGFEINSEDVDHMLHRYSMEHFNSDDRVYGAACKWLRTT